jgi:hypothetical protein
MSQFQLKSRDLGLHLRAKVLLSQQFVLLFTLEMAVIHPTNLEKNKKSRSCW